jgi:hypothetical protein
VTPLQKVAMGLIIVALRVSAGGYDLIADPLGWLLVISGALQLRAQLPAGGTVVGLAALSAVLSLALYPPQVTSALHTDTSVSWLASVPEIAFVIALTGSLAKVAEKAADPTAGRFGTLRWVFVALLFAPVVVYGGQVPALVVPVAVIAVAAIVYLIYLLFKVSKRAWATA